jgi:hypothetical protein
VEQNFTLTPGPIPLIVQLECNRLKPNNSHETTQLPQYSEVKPQKFLRTSRSNGLTTILWRNVARRLDFVNPARSPPHVENFDPLASYLNAIPSLCAPNVIQRSLFPSFVSPHFRYPTRFVRFEPWFKHGFRQNTASSSKRTLYAFFVPAMMAHLATVRSVCNDYWSCRPCGS